MKTLWLTSIPREEEKVKRFMAQMKTYGLQVQGHFWEDNLEKMAWLGPREEMIKPETSLWAIWASPEQLKTPSVRYGLSLLAITVQAKRGLSLPILILLEGKEPLPAEILPTPLKGADSLSSSDPGMPAKVVARVYSPSKEAPAEYRLDVYGTPQIGQWFEVGPAKDTWPGAIFGVAGAEITFHAVGPRGALPSQSTLHYPLKGLKLTLGGMEYTAWAAQNPLDPQTSYFAQVKGSPAALLFGPHSQEEAADLYAVSIG